jgi:hypothetical protein
VSSLSQTTQLAVGGDEPLEQLVVTRIRYGVHLLELLPERDASTPKQELLEARPDLLGVAGQLIAVERFERQRGQRLHDLVVSTF